MFQLGVKYKDKITGFTGIATGHVTYISGCNQALLAPQAKENEFKQSEWFDEQRLELIGETPITLDNASTPGADRSAPRR